MIELGIVFMYLSTYAFKEASKIEDKRGVITGLPRYVRIPLLLLLAFVTAGAVTSILAAVYYLLSPLVLLVFYILNFLHITYRTLRNV